MVDLDLSKLTVSEALAIEQAEGRTITEITGGVQAWQDDRCQQKGGHLVSVYKGSICVSADGRVIE